MNRFFKNNELQDQKIITALSQAAKDFESGAIVEVKDMLIEIIDAISDFEDNE